MDQAAMRELLMGMPEAEEYPHGGAAWALVVGAADDTVLIVGRSRSGCRRSGASCCEDSCRCCRRRWHRTPRFVATAAEEMSRPRHAEALLLAARDPPDTSAARVR